MQGEEIVKKLELFKKVYDGESLIDLPEDVGMMLDCDWNAMAKLVPQDEYGLHKGSFVVTVMWFPDEVEE